MIRSIIGAALLIAGCILFVVSIVGVFRFKYVLNRLHASAIIDTLGTLFMAVGLIVIRGFSWAAVKLIIIVAIMWITSPVGTNRIATLEVSTDEEYKKQVRL